MKTYKLLSGETISLPKLDAATEAFLRRVQDALHDPHVSEDDMIELVYGRENPLLDQTIFPDRGAVTKAVFANPVYHVMLDMLGQKRVQEGRLDVARTHAEFTLSVTEAADRADVHPSAIRQAIASKRIPAVKKGSRWFLRPRDVDNYHPKPYPERKAEPLQIRFGHEPGKSFRVKHTSELLNRKREGATTEATIDGWRRVGVIFSAGPAATFWVLEPDTKACTIERDGYFVRGRFRVVETVREGDAARAAWKAFRPE